MPVHGTRTCYINDGCRCTLCREAQRAYVAALRQRLKLTPIPKESHGLSSTYTNWGCRCRRCCQAHADYCRSYHLRRHQESA